MYYGIASVDMQNSFTRIETNVTNKTPRKKTVPSASPSASPGGVLVVKHGITRTGQPWQRSGNVLTNETARAIYG